MNKIFVLPGALVVIGIVIIASLTYQNRNTTPPQVVKNFGNTDIPKLSDVQGSAPKQNAEQSPTAIENSFSKETVTVPLLQKKNNLAGDINRPGWEILSEKERATLPACGSILMTVSPVPLESITVIEPIGSANPPEHTLASISSDTYIGVVGQGTTETTPLVAPGDMWIILINPRYGVTQDPEDHVIKYAFCKDVYGIVDHVKSFSAEMQVLIDAYPCPYRSADSGNGSCPSLLMAPVKAGTPLGTVGRMQGNFNFGTWDLRVTHTFANISRHGFQTKHSTCPFNYFASPLKEKLIEKIEKTASGACGSVEHDVPGTLAGDWFIGDASPTRHTDWGKLLYFGPNNRFAGLSVISISGIVVPQPTKWVFETVPTGNTNRTFEDVRPGSLYCYDNNGNHPYRNYEKGVLSGRFLVELTSATELKIEHQEGPCQSETLQFKNPTTYIR
ncbi:MAG: hypothetical protein Q8P56_04385 [Candidatus Uhrbacteria bacterium]|nr:hypothetical protein [Candidatus Uhrbacteria bacterium]